MRPPGTKATFTVVDFPGKTFTVNLSRNSGALEVASRSVIAEFDVPNLDSELRAGQFAKVNIQLMRTQPTLWVPARSAYVVWMQTDENSIKNIWTNKILKEIVFKSADRFHQYCYASLSYKDFYYC